MFYYSTYLRHFLNVTSSAVAAVNSMFVSPGMVHKDKPCTVPWSQAVQYQVLRAEPALWKSPGVPSQVEPEHLGRSTLCMMAQHKIVEIHPFWKDVLLWLGSSRANIGLHWHSFLGYSQDVRVFILVYCTPGVCCPCGPRCGLSVWPIFFPVSFTASVYSQQALLPCRGRFAE